MKNILFASSECVPFIKTGGLADVVGSLPKDFDKEKYDGYAVITGRGLFGRDFFVVAVVCGNASEICVGLFGLGALCGYGAWGVVFGVFGGVIDNKP